MRERIGTRAGEVYRYLECNGNCSSNKMKKELQMNSDDLNLALGWLAREDKVDFNKKKSSMTISLR